MHAPESDRTDEPTRTRELIARTLGGDAEAERRLFEAHASALLAHARGAPKVRGLGQHVTPEDIVDETLLRALSSRFLSRFEDRGPDSLRRYLLRIQGRVVDDFYRRLGARKRGAYAQHVPLEAIGDGGESELLPLPAREPSPTSSARANELVELCHAHLRPREWQVWEAVELLGERPADLARRLQVSLSTVTSLLLRARTRMLGVLAEREREIGEGSEDGG